MVDTVQTSVKTTTAPNVNLTAHMEPLSKKSVADEIAHILPGIISAILRELNVTKPITNNINTSNNEAPIQKKQAMIIHIPQQQAHKTPH
eukprot:14893323-Ditylum_brightwellii.AAC.1